MPTHIWDVYTLFWRHIYTPSGLISFWEISLRAQPKQSKNYLSHVSDFSKRLLTQIFLHKICQIYKINFDYIDSLIYQRDLETFLHMLKVLCDWADILTGALSIDETPCNHIATHSFSQPNSNVVSENVNGASWGVTLSSIKLKRSYLREPHWRSSVFT